MKGKETFAVMLLALILILSLGSPPPIEADSKPGTASPDLEVLTGLTAVSTLPGNVFTYQGYLTEGGLPAHGLYDFAFSLYADLAGTQWVTDAKSVNNAQVTNGLFTVPVDLTDAMYGDVHFYLNGEARYLRIGVRPGASTGSYTWLTPLQALTPAPYAQALPGLHTIQNNTSPNVVGGYAWNSINVNAVGATIGGGGKESDRNQVNGDYGTVGGGVGNQAGSYDTVGGGEWNKALGNHATVAGGWDNHASGFVGTVGGGTGNIASGDHATVAGGWQNQATGDIATVGGGLMNVAGTGKGTTVGGGERNVASGQYATVAGGQYNTAAGIASFAAGYRAKANHDGSFVWADYTAADFASTTSNQFRVRAKAGSEFMADNASYGLRVQNSASGDGIRSYATTSSAFWASVYASNSGSGSALYADTSSGTYSGYFMDNIYVDGSCTGCTLVYVAINGGDESLELGDLTTIVGVESPLAGSSASVLQVRQARAGEAVVGIVRSRAVITASEKEGQRLQSVEQAKGAAAPGEYLFIVVSGLAQVKVDASEGTIAVGQRLTTGSQAGHARALRSRLLDGMEVTEGAPQVGIALASLDAGTGLIPVLVTLR
ncbi:MAG: hypothetical protein ACUVWZ_08515 [Anaerolineae bacterium]